MPIFSALSMTFNLRVRFAHGRTAIIMSKLCVWPSWNRAGRITYIYFTLCMRHFGLGAQSAYGWMVSYASLYTRIDRGRHVLGLLCIFFLLRGHYYLFILRIYIWLRIIGHERETYTHKQKYRKRYRKVHNWISVEVFF